MLTESQMLKRFGIDCYWESEIELFHKPKVKKSLLDAIHEAQEKLKQFDAGTLPKEAECRDAIILPLLANSVNITSWGDADLLIKKEYAHTFEDGSRATKRPDIVFFKPPVKLVDFIRATDPTLVYKRDNYYPILNDYTQYCKTFSRVRSSSLIIVEAKRPSNDLVQSNIAQLKGYVASLRGKEAILTNGKKWLWWDDIVNNESSFETFVTWDDDQMVRLLEKFRSSFFKGSETPELDKLNPRLSPSMRAFLNDNISIIETRDLETEQVCLQAKVGKVGLLGTTHPILVPLSDSVDTLRLGTFFSEYENWAIDSYEELQDDCTILKEFYLTDIFYKDRYSLWLEREYRKYHSETNPEGVFSYIPYYAPLYEAIISFWEKETLQKLNDIQAKALVHHHLSDRYFTDTLDMVSEGEHISSCRGDISGWDFFSFCFRPTVN